MILTVSLSVVVGWLHIRLAWWFQSTQHGLPSTDMHTTLPLFYSTSKLLSLPSTPLLCHITPLREHALSWESTHGSCTHSDDACSYSNIIQHVQLQDGAGPASDEAPTAIDKTAWDEHEEMENREEIERDSEKDAKERRARARGDRGRNGVGRDASARATIEKIRVDRQAFKYCSGTVESINTKEGREAGRCVFQSRLTRAYM